MKEISVEELRAMEGQEGLILQGCGGDPSEWLDGINGLLTDEGILLDGTKFTEVLSFEHEGLINLLFSFDDSVKLDMSRLAMWRLRTHAAYGGTCCIIRACLCHLGGSVPTPRMAGRGSPTTFRTGWAGFVLKRRGRRNP